MSYNIMPMTINIWQATISFPCITIMGKSIIGMISYYLMQMSHIHEAKRAAFPRSAPVGEKSIERARWKIIFLISYNMDSGK